MRRLCEQTSWEYNKIWNLSGYFYSLVDVIEELESLDLIGELSFLLNLFAFLFVLR